MKWCIRLFGVLVLCWCTVSVPIAAPPVEVTASGNRQLKMAVVPPQPAGSAIRHALAGEAAEVLGFDLTMSGLVATEQRSAAPQEGGLALSRIDFVPWLSAGFDLLVLGEYEVRGDELTLEFRLFDVVGKKQLTVKRYLGKENDLRRFTHAFSDEILLTLTGTAGPFSSHIVYVSSQSGSKEIWLMDWDGRTPRQLTRNRSISISPDVSPDGREIIFTSYKRGNPDLYKRAFASTVEVPVSTRPGLNITGAWSPDGGKIALGLSKDGNTEIYTINRDGSDPKRLTVSHAANVSPAWSPDGTKIAFVSDRLGKPQIFVMDADGGNVRRVSPNGSYSATPAWSPDGTKIAYTRSAGGYQIFVTTADGSDHTQLTTEGNNERPRWSPDGRLIIFSSRRSGNEAIYAMRADGSGQTRLSTTGGSNTHPAWTPRPR